ncbi:MAG: hypothetical protein ACK5B9_02000 [Flavobacteriia bacterium]
MLTKVCPGGNGKQAVFGKILKTFYLATLEAQGKGIEKGSQK